MFRLFLREKIKSAPVKKNDRNDKTSQKRNRREFERFSVDHKHLTVMNEQDILLVKDISAKGFSSQVSPRAFERLEIGDVYAARIRYLGEIYDLQAKVSRKAGDVVGFELENAERRAVDFMQRVIQPIALAHTLQKVDTNFMQGNTEGKTWYHGDDDTDLYIWRADDGTLTAWQLISSEKFLDWDQTRGLRTGRLVITEESVSGILDVSRKALQQRLDAKPDDHFRQFSIDVVMATDIDDKDDLLSTILE